MISIVIPLYNKEKQIRTTLKSVLAQTFSDYETIIVNDGSTDRSAEEVTKVQDPRIRLIHQENAGVSAARNRGIEDARGEYIAFLDADDRWKPEYLQTQYELTQLYPECSVFACNYEFVDAQGQVKPTIIRKLPFTIEHGVLNNYFEVASCSHPPICSISIMVRKDSILSIGGFPPGIKSGEDLLTWARLACRYKIAFCKISLAQFLYDKKHFNINQQERMPDKPDIVGKELAQLARNNHKISGIRRYISCWHKMRARIYLEKGIRWMSIKECAYSLRWHISIKVAVFFMLNLMPKCLINTIMKKYS